MTLRDAGPGRHATGLVVFMASAAMALGSLAFVLAQVPPGAISPRRGPAATTAPAASDGDEARAARGRRIYRLWCSPCHGESGAGDGIAAHAMRPPPRDLRQGQYKFGWVVDGLPDDDAFRRILRGGLRGTGMLSWDLDDDDLDAVIGHVKGLAPQAWSGDVVGSPVVLPPDPWARASEAGEARGRDVYHGVARCWSCHPAHVARSEVAALAGTSDLREDLHDPVLRRSEYRSGGRELTILPPDLAFHALRSVRPGSELEDLFRVIAAGIPGTAMPAWRDGLSDDDLWALAHYVASLQRLRGNPQEWPVAR